VTQAKRTRRVPPPTCAAGAQQGGGWDTTGPPPVRALSHAGALPARGPPSSGWGKQGAAAPAAAAGEAGEQAYSMGSHRSVAV